MDFRLCILVGKGEGESFELLPGREYTVGRHSENDIKVVDKNVSRNHFMIQVKKNSYLVTDLFSKNGTFVGGRDLQPGIATEVKEGIPIVIGMTILGLGRRCKSCLKPFLDSAGFGSQVNEYREAIEPRRTQSIKRNMEFIYNLNNSLMEAKDLKEISTRLVHAIFNLLRRIDRCVILLIDDQTGKIRNIIGRSRKHVDDPKNIYNRELVEQVLLMNRPMMVDDSSKLEDGDDRVTESLQLMKIRSAMCVPIAGCFGMRGAIYVDSLERPNGFRKGDLALLKDVGGRAAVAMDTLSLQI